MRAVFNSFLVALVVTALFWGNCLSCPQVLLSAQRHSCCPHGKADPSQCKTQGLRDFVKAEKAPQAAPAAAVAVAAVPPAESNLPAAVLVPPAIREFSPPDLLPLRI